MTRPTTSTIYAATGADHQVPDSDVLHRAKGYLPSTFAERGCYVPFTTEILNHARIRYNAEQSLEALVPGLSGGSGIYVIPWDMLPTVIPLSVHDRMLHESLTNEKFVTPLAVRDAAIEVSKTGVGGVEMATDTQAMLGAEAKRRELSRFVLVTEAIRQLGEGAAAEELTMEDLATPDGQKRACGALHGFARSIGQTDQSVINSLAQWSFSKAEVGLNKDGCEGRLRIMMHKMRDWHREMMEWGVGELTDMEFMSVKCADALAATLIIADEHLKKLDSQDASLASVLKHWERAQSDVEHLINKLCWLLDGWGFLMEKWDATRDAPRYEQRQILEEIVSFLPLVPVDELTGDTREMWEGLSQNQATLAKSAQDQQTAAVDREVMEQLEKYHKDRG